MTHTPYTPEEYLQAKDAVDRMIGSAHEKAIDLQCALTRKESELATAVGLLREVRPVIIMSAGKRSRDWGCRTDKFLDQDTLSFEV